MKTIIYDQRGVPLKKGDAVCFLVYRYCRSSYLRTGIVVGFDRYVQVATGYGTINKMPKTLLKLAKVKKN